MYAGGRPKKEKLSEEDLVKWEKRLKAKEERLNKKQLLLKKKDKKTKEPVGKAPKTDKYSKFELSKPVDMPDNFHSMLNDLDSIFKPMSLMIEFPNVQDMTQKVKSKSLKKNDNSEQYYRSVNMHTLNNQEAMVEINENGNIRNMVVPLSQVHNYV